VLFQTDYKVCGHFGPKKLWHCVWCQSVSHFCVGAMECLGQFGTKMHEILQTQN